MLAPPPAGAAGALGVGAGATGAGPPVEEPVEDTVELARPIFVGVASFVTDGIEPFLDTFARPIVNGIIPDAAVDFLLSIMISLTFCFTIFALKSGSE